MIHGLKLASIIDERLTELVHLQIHLLYCAATRDPFNDESCAKYLDEKSPFKGKGVAIADWLWKQGTSTRHEYLEKFATTYAATGKVAQKKERECKRQWCKRLAREVGMLSDKSIDYIEIADFFGNE